LQQGGGELQQGGGELQQGGGELKQGGGGLKQGGGELKQGGGGLKQGGGGLLQQPPGFGNMDWPCLDIVPPWFILWSRMTESNSLDQDGGFHSLQPDTFSVI